VVETAPPNVVYQSSYSPAPVYQSSYSPSQQQVVYSAPQRQPVYSAQQVYPAPVQVSYSAPPTTEVVLSPPQPAVVYAQPQQVAVQPGVINRAEIIPSPSVVAPQYKAQIPQAVAMNCRPITGNEARMIASNIVPGSVVEGLRLFTNQKNCVGFLFSSFAEANAFATATGFEIVLQQSEVSFHNLAMIEARMRDDGKTVTGKYLPAIRTDFIGFDRSKIIARVAFHTAFIPDNFGLTGDPNQLLCCYFVIIEKDSSY
jgi:hypothetical protein